jgi:uncharacterized protein (DUF2252 family)
VPPVLPANSAILVKRVLKVKGATPVKWATPVQLVLRAKEATQAKEATRVKLGLKVQWVPPALKVNEVPRVKKEHKVIPVLPVKWEHKVLSALLALSAPTVNWEQLAQWAHRGLAVQSVLKVWRA